MRIIKLTESDLEKIIKKVLKEDADALPQMENVPLGKVEAVQSALKNLGQPYAGLLGTSGSNGDGVDGKFGRNTRAAVIKYQKDNGIKQTGNVGPLTGGKLGVQPLTSGKPSTQTKTGTPNFKSGGGGRFDLSPSGRSIGGGGGRFNSGKVTPKTSQIQTKTGGKTSSKLPQFELPFTPLKPSSQSSTYLTPPIAKGLAIKTGDYLMIIAFPQYEPKVDKGEKVSWIEKAAIMTQTGETPREGTYGKIGHAGVALISKSGDVTLFEFGRYNTKKGQGAVKSKSLGKIAKIDSSGNFINSREVAKIVKASTQGDGPRLDMVTAVVPVPSLEKARAFAGGPAIREYEAADMSQGGSANCGTFAIDTAKAGGVPIGDFCTPMPVKMISKFKDYSSEYFNV